MFPKKYAALCLVVTFFLAACSIASPNSAQADSQNCLIGSWELSGFDSYINTLLPPGAFEPNTLNFSRVTGKLTYTFNDSKTVTIKAAKFASIYDVKVDPQNMELDVLMDGDATAKYSQQGNQITIGDVTQNNMTYSAILDQVVMMESKNVDEFAPLFVRSNNSAEYECSPDTLKLKASNLPAGFDPIEFKRVGP